MIVVILICTVIGYLCGSALIGLGVGLMVFAVTVWADQPAVYRARKRKRIRRK